MAPATESSRHGLRVLTAGWQLFLAGLPKAFPWVLAAELTQLLPFANPPGGLFDTDLSLLADPSYLSRAVVFGLLQAWLYGIAVLKLAAFTREETPTNSLLRGARTAAAVLLAYLAYELMVAMGLILTFAMFMLGIFVLGPLAGVVLCILPLAPTAAASTALGLFIFPAVLERRGPFAALGESSRLAKQSWLKVSLVLSVPALVLLAANLLADAPSLQHGASAVLEQLNRMQDAESTDQAASLLSGLKSGAAPDRYGVWQVVSVLLGAFAWWYTLAVCYAQYRDLKTGDKV